MGSFAFYPYFSTKSSASYIPLLIQTVMAPENVLKEDWIMEKWSKSEC